MDALTHTLSGLAAGTAVSVFTVKERGVLRSLPAALAGMAGGFMPDIDAVSLWRGFDPLFSRLHGSPPSGKEIYFGKWAFSHHGAMHSILAGVFFAFLLLFVSGVVRLIYKKWKSPRRAFTASMPASIALFAGYCMHLLGDIPTPGYVWGGIRLWWPASFYTGGLGRIWWWNNYDIFLVVLSCVIVNFMLLAASAVIRRTAVKYLPLIVLLTMIAASAMMVSGRQYTYNYTSYKKQFAELEKKSLDEQRSLLGERLFGIMAGIDKRLPFNF